MSSIRNKCLSLKNLQDTLWYWAFVNQNLVWSRCYNYFLYRGCSSHHFIRPTYDVNKVGKWLFPVDTCVTNWHYAILKQSYDVRFTNACPFNILGLIVSTEYSWIKIWCKVEVTITFSIEDAQAIIYKAKLWWEEGWQIIVSQGFLHPQLALGHPKSRSQCLVYITNACLYKMFKILFGIEHSWIKIWCEVEVTISPTGYAQDIIFFRPNYDVNKVGKWLFSRDSLPS